MNISTLSLSATLTPANLPFAARSSTRRTRCCARAPSPPRCVPLQGVLARVSGPTFCHNPLFHWGGQVDARTIEKYEKEAKEKNRDSWFLAFIMVRRPGCVGIG